MESNKVAKTTTTLSASNAPSTAAPLTNAAFANTTPIPLIDVTSSLVSQSAAASSTSATHHLIKRMNALLDSNTGDLKIIGSDDKSINVHLNIMCSASDYFKLVKRDGKKELKVEEAICAELYIIIRYIYTSEIIRLENAAVRHVLNILNIARMWMIDDLVEDITSKIVLTYIPRHSWVIYAYACEFNFNNIKIEALKFIKSTISSNLIFLEEPVKDVLKKLKREDMEELLFYIACTKTTKEYLTTKTD